jgi:carbamoyl-phosphate synthase large subunit
MSKERRITVMVTGVGGGGNGEQLLKALRMSSQNYEIVGCDMSPFSCGLIEVDHPYICPPATAPDYIDCILKIAKKHDVKALFSGSEPELKVISMNRNRIVDAGIFLPVNPQHVIDTCMDKSKTMLWLSENGFHCPRTVIISSMEDLDKVDFCPAVLKPSVGGGGSANTFLAQNSIEVTSFAEYLLKMYPQFIIQEYIGTTESEYTVGVLIDMDGHLLNSIAVKKYIMSGLSNRLKVANKSNNSSLGSVLAISSGVSQGEIGRFPEVTEECEKIAVAMGCRSAVNVQCRLYKGKVHVFEINPRFSGTTSLRAMVGYNEPDVLLKIHVLNQKIYPRFLYEEGRIMRGLKETLIIDKNIPDARELE